MLLLCIFMLSFENKYKPNDKQIVVKQKRSVPLFNYNTQRVDPFIRIGVLYKNESNVILPLYGRRTYARSITWNYYTVTNDDNKIEIELNINNRRCLKKIGCKEIENGDTIFIPEYSGMFSVKLYN